LGCLSKLKREVDQLWPNRSYSVSVRLSRSDGVMECLLDVHHG
jgi:hypothetical protein